MVTYQSFHLLELDWTWIEVKNMTCITAYSTFHPTKSYSKKFPFLMIDEESECLVGVASQDDSGEACLLRYHNSEVDQDFWSIKKGNLSHGLGYKSYDAYDFSLEYPEFQDYLPIYQQTLSSEDIFQKEYETFSSFDKKISESILSEFEKNGQELESPKSQKLIEVMVEAIRPKVFELLDGRCIATIINESNIFDNLSMLTQYDCQYNN